MEDFVPFEIAKKLKEKGFDKYCCRAYNEIGCFNDTDTYKDSEEFYCYAPTISQVLKWLREKYATHIEIALGRNGWYFEIVQYEYYEEENEYDCKLMSISVIYDSYELAALAGIEYYLDNLI